MVSVFGVVNLSVGTSVIAMDDAENITLVAQANSSRVLFNASDNWQFSEHLNFDGLLVDYSFSRNDFGELQPRRAYNYSELNSNVDRFNPAISSIIYAEYQGQPFLFETFIWEGARTNFRVTEVVAIPEPSYFSLFSGLLWTLGRRR